MRNRRNFLKIFGAILIGFLLIPGWARADLNGDGFADVVFSGQFNNEACLGDGCGNFTCDEVEVEVQSPSAISIVTSDVDVGIMDGDDNPDAVFADGAAFDFICRGDGGGGVVDCSLNNVASTSLAVALGDVDGNGKLDAFFAGEFSFWCPGDGTGKFSSEGCAVLDVDGAISGGVALGDIDNDGDLDAAFAIRASGDFGENMVCIQDNSHDFECSHVSSDQDDSYDVALGYMNGDGNLDAVFANEDNDQVCFGDGSGGFVDCKTIIDQSPNSQSLGVALGDVEGDGDLDVVFANFGERNQLCLNNGEGGITCILSVSTDENNSNDVALEDLNGDELLDVIISNEGQANRRCLGKLLGENPSVFLFDSCTDVSSSVVMTTGLAVSPGNITDGDNDGDLITNNCDNCPQDANSDQEDTDADGAGDACDECPDDPNEVIEGACGCGQPETDSDGDGTPDCQDLCERDPAKVDPGICGCGVADTDSDGDGTPDCQDLCERDPAKIAPGICGCGVADTDSDVDGVADCRDICPGFDDNQDLDGDGLPDGCDMCPNDPNNDADGDTICGDIDLCLDTTVPESVPNKKLGRNRFALVDGNPTFDTSSGKGKGPSRLFTLQDTAGCSCEQIITRAGLGQGHTKFGCSIGAMEDWVGSVSP